MRILVAAVIWIIIAAPASAAVWAIDTAETFVLLDVAYFTGGSVTIRLDDVDGDISFDPRRPAETKARIVVKTGTAQSGLGLLDPVVRGKGFLNVRAHPTIIFDFSDLVQTGPSDAEVSGIITVFGISKPLQLQARVVRFRPEVTDPTDRIVSFNLFGQIDRRDFGNTTQSELIRSILPIRIHLALRPVS